MFFKGKAKGWAYCKKLAVFGIALSFMLMTGTIDNGKLLNIALGVGLSGVLIGFLHTPVVKELYGKSVPKEEETVELGEEEEDVEATEAAEA
jgi:hypothetical protein